MCPSVSISSSRVFGVAAFARDCRENTIGKPIRVYIVVCVCVCLCVAEIIQRRRSIATDKLAFGFFFRFLFNRFNGKFPVTSPYNFLYMAVEAVSILHT